MPNTYKKIASVTVGSGGAASINFTSIPQTYTDLKVVLSGRNSANDPAVDIQFNSSTSNLSARDVYGSGAAVSSNTFTTITGYMARSTYTASVFGNVEFYIPNYTSSNYKSVSVDSVAENNATATAMNLSAGLWSNTDAITSIKLVPQGAGNFAQYSTATLYGIGDVTASKFAKAVGGVITYDANYVYHTYPYSGTFTPNTALTVDYLVVAGGGGGGAANVTEGGGGGGAGGLRCTVTATGGGGNLESPLSLTSNTNYTVTIGGGGSGVNAANGNNGSNSVFATITSTGGGGGVRVTQGSTGGSGGGGGSATNAGNYNGVGTANQGYTGGTGGINPRAAGGGGGAGALGGAGNASGQSGTAGSGGIGIATSISGVLTYYAGGGGGATDINIGTAGTGGSGGGGNGSKTGRGSNGTNNTGGGGGGSVGSPSTTEQGGNGGSGIVIIRYPR